MDCPRRTREAVFQKILARATDEPKRCFAPIPIASLVLSRTPSRDGYIRAYDINDGSLIWEYNTYCEFETVNGIKAQEVSFSASGVTIARNRPYAGSGYRGDPLGNAVIAFELAP